MLQFVRLLEASSQQHDVAVSSSARDEDRRLGAAQVSRNSGVNNMRAPVDGDCRHRWRVSEEHGPIRAKQRHIVEAADVPGQAQLKRLTQLCVAAFGAFGGFIDEDGANPLHVRARDLKIDEPESCRRRHGDRETEREREAKGLRSEDLSRQHSI